MAYNFLHQAISQFSGISTGISYIFPTVNKLNAGTYASEILDVQEVLREDGSLEAFDFFHQLTDCNGNITHVRFRYYEKELPALVTSLKQYPQVKTWKDAVGLQEEVIVTPKPAGSYMHIAARKASASNGSNASSNASSTSSQTPKRVGIAPRFGIKRDNKPSSASKSSRLSEDDFDDCEEDEIDED